MTVRFNISHQIKNEICDIEVTIDSVKRTNCYPRRYYDWKADFLIMCSSVVGIVGIEASEVLFFLLTKMRVLHETL